MSPLDARLSNADEARVVTLPAVTHLMPLQDPAGVADLLADILAEHPTSEGRLRTPANPAR
jgi:hypothetical protein